MAIAKVLAGASLVFLALAVAPVAQAENAGTTVTHPHRTVDPARKAARQARRKHWREMREQRRLQRQQGSAPTPPPPN